MKRASLSLIALLLVLLVGAEALAGLPSRPASAQSSLASQDPTSLLWTPLAEVKLGAEADVARLLFLGGTFGDSYVLTAPADGVVEYLYPWTGFFQIGQPLVRLYDPGLLKDLTAARAGAKFDARPFLLIAPPQRTAFPSPTVAARALRMPTPVTSPAGAAPALTPKPEPPRIGLERIGQDEPVDLQVAALEKALARAQRELVEIEEELQARKQLNESGVLEPEEVTRFQTMRAEAQAAVRTAQRNLTAARRPEAPAPAPALPPAARPQTTMTLLKPTVPPAPVVLQRISQPRWSDVFAPTSGAVMQPLQAPGTVVKKGAPLLRISNSAWSRVRALTTPELAAAWEPGTAVRVTFPDMGDLAFYGQVARKQVWAGDERAEVDLLITQPDAALETQPLLFDLAYGSSEVRDLEEAKLVASEERLPAHGDLPQKFFGVVPRAVRAAEARHEAVDPTAPLAGRLALIPTPPRFGPVPCVDPELQARLTQLHEWQTSFIQGMTTLLYDQKITLSYPRDGEISKAVEKMVRGEVEHDPGYCARTLRLALGWGLGDAHQWAIQLPQRGWKAREDGLPRPGDILVWPFTYGINHSQHIGVAVNQNGRMVMLSNLEGRLGTSPILGGYVAFYKPDETPAPQTTGTVKPVPPAPPAR